MSFSQDSFATGASFAEYIDWRVDHPSDDLMTELLHAEFEDETGTTRRLTRAEVLTYVNVVAGAGNETTVKLIGWTGKVLADHPDQRRELARNRSLIPNAIEEILRYEPPTPHVARYVVRSVEYYGQKVPEGSAMLFLAGAANRDPRRYPDGDRFDIHREIGQHLTFGRGIHFCMGAALARMQGRVALDEVLQRFPEWEVDRDSAAGIHLDRSRLGDAAGPHPLSHGRVPAASQAGVPGTRSWRRLEFASGGGPMQGLAAASILLLVGISLVVGVRLLALWLRTRGLPELLLGTMLVLLCGIGYPGQIVALRLEGAAVVPVYLLSNVAISVAIALLYLFTWRVFRAQDRWALVFACAGAAALGFNTVARAQEVLVTHDIRMGAANMLEGMLQTAAVSVAYLWTAWESLRHHEMMKRRVRIGLADPTVANRFLLWGTMSLFACMGIRGVPPRSRWAST